MDPEGRSEGTTRCGLKTALPPTLKTTPPGETQESDGEGVATEDPDLEEPPELGLEVTCFLRGLAKNLETEGKAPSPKPPLKELHKWVTWKVEACELPSWWRELLAVPKVKDYEKLAWEVQASFRHPKRVSELHQMKNYNQAPPAPPCLLWKSFLPQLDSIFACRDIWEIEWEKMVAYAQALQHWAEKADPPAEGRPCLLAESVKELQEEMRCYLSSDEEVLKGMVPLEEMSAVPTEEANPRSTEMPVGTPEEQATMMVVREPAAERRSPKFLGWEKILHPSWPMVAAGQIPHPSRGPRLREERMVWIPQTEILEMMTPLQEMPLPP